MACAGWRACTAGSGVTGSTRTPTLGWLEPFVAFEGMQYAPLHIAHERLGDTVAPEILALSGTDLFVDIWARYIGTLTRSPRRCCMATRTSATPMCCRTTRWDSWTGRWPGAATGPWISAISCRARSPSRTADMSERNLLDQYRDALELPADEMPSADEVWLRYRASVAHGLAIWMATSSGGDAWQGPGNIRHAGAAVLRGVRRSGDAHSTGRHRRITAPICPVGKRSDIRV